MYCPQIYRPLSLCIYFYLADFSVWAFLFVSEKHVSSIISVCCFRLSPVLILSDGLMFFKHFSFPAQHEDELNIFCGEALTILEDNGTGWIKAQRTETEFGLVPGNYIEKY